MLELSSKRSLNMNIQKSQVVSNSFYSNRCVEITNKSELKLDIVEAHNKNNIKSVLFKNARLFFSTPKSKNTTRNIKIQLALKANTEELIDAITLKEPVNIVFTTDGSSLTCTSCTLKSQEDGMVHFKVFNIAWSDKFAPVLEYLRGKSENLNF